MMDGVRDRQRAQCAAIPYRMTQDGRVEVLLVTSRGKGHWILPKGHVKPGKSAAISAQEEVYEEAGACGSIHQTLHAAARDPRGSHAPMQIFTLQVDRLAITWPEMFQRKRRWVSLRQAMRTIRKAYEKQALEIFAAHMMPLA
ncbi:NUDIX hydrolase [Novosphingobium terrae]|uniref:NUDIX hydrolase n=1 Tax=Novosphingobium terrae TaxID=2726189 RepID=UPI001980B3FD|nr:NUDIX hydrolase [Novosphingobium terrae]